jgi:hypothetical protein
MIEEKTAIKKEKLFDEFFIYAKYGISFIKFCQAKSLHCQSKIKS